MEDQNLSVGAFGEAVADLHRKLAAHGFDIPAAEVDRQFFGPVTREAVRACQKEHRLTATGAMDERTHAALTAALAARKTSSPPPAAVVPRAMPTGPGEERTARATNQAVDAMEFLVEGRVASRDRAGVDGLRIDIVDKNVGKDIPLGRGVTDSSGGYSIQYSVAALQERRKEKPDIQVRVYAGETFLAASEVRYNAGKQETLHVLLPDKAAAVLPSEHETLTGALAAHYAGGLRDLKESDDQQDITYLANKTGWDARAVALAALADQFGQHSVDLKGAPAIKPAFYYALFRAGLPANSDTLYQADAQTVGGVWKRAIEQGVLPAAMGQEIGGAVEAFQRLSAQKMLTGPALAGVSPLQEMLSVSRLDAEGQQKFAELYAVHRTDMPAFWKAIGDTFGNNAAKRLQVDGKLGFLTINNAPLMQELHKGADNGLSDPQQLAQLGYHRAKEWSALLTPNIPVPKEIPGDTPEAKRGNYAEYLAAQVRLSYPTAAVAQMVKSGDLPLTGATPGVADNVHQFLTEHQGKFEIGVQPVQQYIASNKLKVADDTVTQVKRLQRIYQITPSDDAMIGLLGAHKEAEKLDAAYHIVRYQKEDFVTRFAEALKGEDNAAMTYDKSVQVHNAVLNIAISYLTAKNGIGIGAHSLQAATQQGPDTAGQILKPEPNPSPADNAGDVIAYPTLEKLFGEMDFCACDHCRSILSPAAYLVDLLLFIDQEPTTADKKAGKENPQDVLLERRPDIAQLPLTCENTNTALPYIDVVNEALEYFIANDKQKLSLKEYTGHDTDGAASEDLLASPQSFNDGVRDAAYTTLRGERFPTPLPFHQPLETLRRYFEKFKVALPLAMERFRKGNALERDAAPYGWRDILIEELRLSRAEYDLLTNGTLTLAQLYGVGPAHPDVIATLSNARDFTRRVEITYDDLIALLKTRFINPNSDLIPKLERLGVPIATLVELKTKNDGPTDAAFDARLRHRAGALDPAEYGGDIKAWVKNEANFARIMGLITLVDPTNSDDPCRFDNLEFRHATPMKDKNDTSTRLGEVEFARLLRFIRLWKKMGWTIEQTDAAICALYKADLTPMTGNDIDSLAELDAGFVTLLPRLSIAVRVLHALNLTAKRDLLPLLAVWSDIGTHGASALYRRLFLNPVLLKQDDVFKDNGFGEFLTDGTKKLLDHAEALRAALNLTGDEFDRIVTALGFKANPDPNTPLTIPNVSKVFRVGWLARQLRLSVREFLLLTQLTGLDPFAAPDPTNPAITQIIALVQALKDRSLKSATALYLIWNQDLSGKSAPGAAQVSDFARTLRSNLARIESEFAIADDPTGEIARARMILTYGTDAADFFFGLLNGSFTVDALYTHFEEQFGPALATAIQNAAGSVGDPPLSRVAYDDFRKRLTFTGVLSAAMRDAIKAVAVAPAVVATIPPAALAGFQAAFPAAADTLYTANQAAVGPFFARYGELLPLYTTFITSPDPPQTKRSALLANFLPALVCRRKQQQTLQAVADAAQTDRAFAEVLLDATPVGNGLHTAARTDQPALHDLLALETPGLSVQFFDSDTAAANLHPAVLIAANLAYAAMSANTLPPNATTPGNAISGLWSGCIEAPENGLYNLIIETEPGATVTLTLDGKTAPLTQNGVVWRNAAPIALKGGTLYAIELTVEKVRSALRVQWETAGRGREVIPARSLYPAIRLDAASDAYLRFLKAAALAAALELSAAETARPVLNGATWLNALPVVGSAAAPSTLLPPLRDLLDYTRIKADLSPGDDRLFTLLSDPVKATQRVDGADSLLFTVTRWDPPSLNDVLAHFGGSLAGLSSLDLFRRVYDAFALIMTMGIAGSALINATTNEPDAPTVHDLQAALRARYETDDWRTLIQPINDAMRGLQRDALVTYILHQMRETPTTEHIDTADKLFEYFLMDIQMEPCMQTSRIRHALSSVQLFIERCLMNLEPRVSPASIVATQWVWMKRYRVWEANRKIFLYPENWLEPELRDDKSPFFKEIESELLQSDITEESATIALLNYLAKLEDVAKLEPCGIYHIPADAAKHTGEVDHIIARTAGANRHYYYRRYDDGAWTPWEQVKLDIEDNPVMPVVWNGRLLLFWLRILKQTPLALPASPTHPTAPDGTEPNLANVKLSEVKTDAKNHADANVKVTVQAVLCWSEYYNGKWQGTKTSDINNPTGLGHFAPQGGTAFDRSSLGLSVLEWFGALEVTIFRDWGSSWFVLYNTHSVPVRQEDHPRKNGPYKEGRYRSLHVLDDTYSFSYGEYSSRKQLSRSLLKIKDGMHARMSEPEHALENAWDAPFFLEDSRHVFFVTTDEEPVRIKDKAGYGATVYPSFQQEAQIPPLVFEIDPRFQIGPKTGGAPIINPGVIDRGPIEQFVTEDAHIKRGIGMSGSVPYGNKEISPSGALPDRQVGIEGF
jgi:hypothetical protein